MPRKDIYPPVPSFSLKNCFKPRSSVLEKQRKDPLVASRWSGYLENDCANFSVWPNTFSPVLQDNIFLISISEVLIWTTHSLIYPLSVCFSSLSRFVRPPQEEKEAAETFPFQSFLAKFFQMPFHTLKTSFSPPLSAFKAPPWLLAKRFMLLKSKAWWGGIFFDLLINILGWSGFLCF